MLRCGSLSVLSRQSCPPQRLAVGEAESRPAADAATAAAARQHRAIGPTCFTFRPPGIVRLSGAGRSTLDVPAGGGGFGGAPGFGPRGGPCPLRGECSSPP